MVRLHSRIPPLVFISVAALAIGACSDSSTEGEQWRFDSGSPEAGDAGTRDSSGVSDVDNERCGARIDRECEPVTVDGQTRADIEVPAVGVRFDRVLDGELLDADEAPTLGMHFHRPEEDDLFRLRFPDEDAQVPLTLPPGDYQLHGALPDDFDSELGPRPLAQVEVCEDGEVFEIETTPASLEVETFIDEERVRPGESTVFGKLDDVEVFEEPDVRSGVIEYSGEGNAIEGSVWPGRYYALPGFNYSWDGYTRSVTPGASEMVDLESGDEERVQVRLDGVEVDGRVTFDGESDWTDRYENPVLKFYVPDEVHGAGVVYRRIDEDGDFAGTLPDYRWDVWLADEQFSEKRAATRLAEDFVPDTSSGATFDVETIHLEADLLRDGDEWSEEVLSRFDELRIESDDGSVYRTFSVDSLLDSRRIDARLPAASYDVYLYRHGGLDGFERRLDG
ncbi:MAG: hypothetical protein ACOCV2_14375, partial [Persicimonas sp.]